MSADIPGPANNIYVCVDARDYERVATICAYKYGVRALEDGPWSAWAIRTLRNWIVALVKSQQYAEAESMCGFLIDTIIPRYRVSGTPVEMVVRCNLASCLVLAGRPHKLDVNEYTRLASRYDEISRTMPSPEWALAREELEALEWVRRTGEDHLVLRDSQDGLAHLLMDVDSYHEVALVESNMRLAGRQRVEHTRVGPKTRSHRSRRGSDRSRYSVSSAVGIIQPPRTDKFEVLDHETWHRRYGLQQTKSPGRARWSGSEAIL